MLSGELREFDLSSDLLIGSLSTCRHQQGVLAHIGFDAWYENSTSQIRFSQVPTQEVSSHAQSVHKFKQFILTILLLSIGNGDVMLLNLQISKSKTFIGLFRNLASNRNRRLSSSEIYFLQAWELPFWSNLNDIFKFVQWHFVHHYAICYSFNIAMPKIVKVWIMQALETYNNKLVMDTDSIYMNIEGTNEAPRERGLVAREHRDPPNSTANRFCVQRFQQACLGQ